MNKWQFSIAIYVSLPKGIWIIELVLLGQFRPENPVIFVEKSTVSDWDFQPKNNSFIGLFGGTPQFKSTAGNINQSRVDMRGYNML